MKKILLIMLKTILGSVWNFIRKVLSSMGFKDFLIVALAILCVRYVLLSKHYEQQSIYVTVAYNDSIESYKNKLKQEYQAKNIYAQTVEQLKKSNKELYEEIKNLKDNPIIVTKTKIEFKTDTVYANSDSIQEHPGDTVRTLYWSYRNDGGYFSFNGMTDVHTDFSEFRTVVTNMQVPAMLTLDVIEQGAQFRVIGRSDNPYVKITDMNGVVVDPAKSKNLRKYFKQKRWTLNANVGYGVNTLGQFAPQLNVGIGYTILPLW